MDFYFATYFGALVATAATGFYLATFTGAGAAIAYSSYYTYLRLYGFTYAKASYTAASRA